MRARCAAIIIALCLALPALAPHGPADAAAPSVALSALETLQRYYVAPVRAAPLLNAALDAVRAHTNLPAAAVPAIPDSASDTGAREAFARDLAAASRLSGVPAITLQVIAATAMLASLHDSHTYFVGPHEYAVMMASITNRLTYGGIGVSVEIWPDATGTEWPVVMQVFPGTPAEAAGLRRFDALTSVDGGTTAFLTLDQLSAHLRGAPGAPVVLGIRRQRRTLIATITRRAITMPPVMVQIVQPGIALVTVASFSFGVSGMIRDALAGIPALRGIILDLRGNHGGLITEAAGVCSLFLPAGTTISTVIDRSGARSAIRTAGSPPFAAIPLAVLVDHGSASSAEVVASALQEARRAALIGERTAGALGGALIIHLPLGAMSVTVERVLAADGRVIEGAGVAPDAPAPLIPSAIFHGVDPGIQHALAWLATAAPTAAATPSIPISPSI